MPVLNMDRYYYLDTPRFQGDINLEHRIQTSAWMSRNFDNDPINYFYTDFKNGNAFDYYPLNTIITDDEIDMIKRGDAMLCLNNSHEAYHHIIEPLYISLVIKQQIPAQQILLLSESADIADEITRVAHKYRLPEIKAEWITQFEWNIRSEKGFNLSQGIKSPKTLIDKEYTKKYLSFNRRWRMHRVMLVAMLCATNTLHKGYVSLGRADDNQTWEGLWNYLNDLFPVHTEIGDLLRLHKDEITSLPDLYLDTDELTVNQPTLTSKTDDFYSNSYFSVVTETNFFKPDLSVHFETSRFLSEKTFKPVAEKHPFIIVSVPNFLEKFRELGYKSFSPYIDESYDLELDDNKRLMKIVREINRLSNLTKDELSTFLNGVRGICDFNYNRLMTKDVWTTRLNY